MDPNVRSVSDLTAELRRIDGRPYGAYKDLASRQFAFEGVNSPGCPFILRVEHVQSDSYAPPSRMSVSVRWADAGFSEDLRSSKTRSVALCDFLARTFCARCASVGADQGAGRGGNWNAAKGGELVMDQPGQHVLERTAVFLSPDGERVEARFCVALPAAGRTILGKQAAQILTATLPSIVRDALVAAGSWIDVDRVGAHADSTEAQVALRAAVVANEGVAFVRNGARLPRASGADDAPMEGEGVVLFASPPEMERTFEVPHAGAITGMFVPRGITLIVGGGFHGKTTLLKALELGVYVGERERAGERGGQRGGGRKRGRRRRKNGEREPETEMDRQRDRQRDRQSNRQRTRRFTDNAQGHRKRHT